jgi:hypothetical protein
VISAPWDDVYGLGGVLSAIPAGKPPFQGDSALETIAQVKDRALEPPSRHGRRIDRDLETLRLVPDIGTPSADIIGLSVDPALTLGITGTGLPASGRFLDTTST